MEMGRCRVVDTAGVRVDHNCACSWICRDGEGAGAGGSNNGYTLIAIKTAESEHDVSRNNLTTNLAARVRGAMYINVRTPGENGCELRCIQRLLFQKPVLRVAAILYEANFDRSVSAAKSSVQM